MSNGHAVYTDPDGFFLNIFIDVDLKTEKIQDIYFKGNLETKYSLELNQLKNLVLNHSISDALLLKRSNLKDEVRLENGNFALASLSLWLLHLAIDDYRGNSASLNEQNDFLCLCYGIGLRELRTQVLSRSNYELSHLISETMATSACGSCKVLIQNALVTIREEHGLILGLDHSQSRLDKAGRWLKIKNLYPADLLIRLDDLKKTWMKREKILEQFEIEIVKIEGYHLWLTILLKENVEHSSKISSKQSEGLLVALGDFWHSELGALFFLHLL